MRRLAIILAVAPLLIAMTCNPNPRPHPEIVQGLDRLQGSVDRLNEREIATANMWSRAAIAIDKMADRIGALDQRMQNEAATMCPCTPVPQETPALIQRERVK
jgi:hypothetical protein